MNTSTIAHVWPFLKHNRKIKSKTQIYLIACQNNKQKKERRKIWEQKLHFVNKKYDTFYTQYTFTYNSFFCLSR